MEEVVEYHEDRAISGSAYRNKNGTPTVSFRLASGRTVYLHPQDTDGKSGDDLARAKVCNRIVKQHLEAGLRSLLGTQVPAADGIPVTVRETVTDDGAIRVELASAPSVDDGVIALLGSGDSAAA